MRSDTRRRAAADLVLIGRADAAAGGADLAGAGGILADDVELAMERQDQHGIVGDAQIVPADGDALPAHGVDLLEQRPGIDNDAIADDGELARPDDPRRQQRQLVGDLVDDQRVAGIVAALETHHDIGALRQPVDDLALALVAPLRADNHHIGHRPVPSPEARI